MLAIPGWIEAVAQSVYDTGWATGIRESEIIFPVIETVHVLGLTLMAGTIAVVDLRLLGLALPEAPGGEVERRIVPLTWLGFALMTASGGLLTAAEAAKIIHNPAFQAKLALLALAGINMILFQWRARPRLLAVPNGGAIPASARAGAVVSLALWAAVIAAGRAIAYF